MESSGQDTPLEAEEVLVRTMQGADLEAIVQIDAAASGRRRPAYFESMMRRSLDPSSLQISLVAQWEGRAAGFLIGSVFQGEFGIMEPAATVDAIGVDSRLRGRGLGRALIRQLRKNLAALRVFTLRTEVEWDDFDLLAFFKHEGFGPVSRICLEATIDATSPDD